MTRKDLFKPQFYPVHKTLFSSRSREVCSIRSIPRRNEVGAAALETTLVFVLFMFVVVATVYFGFFIISKAMVDTGIDHGLQLASRHPALAEDPPNCSSYGADTYACCVGSQASTKWCQAYIEVRNDLTAVARNTVLKTSPSGFAYVDLSDSNSVSLTIPLAATSEEQRTILTQKPIQASVTYRVRHPLFPSTFVPLTRVGYMQYEIPAVSDRIVRMDCAGYPEGSPGFNSNPCDCNTAAGEGEAIINGVRVCVPCSSLAPLASPILDSDHITNTYNTTSVPESTCYCPSYEYCEEQYNTKGAATYVGSCKCYCAYSAGYTNNTAPDYYLDPGEQCECTRVPPASYPSSAPNKVHFKPTTVEHDFGYFTGCACVIDSIDPGVGGTPFTFTEGGNSYQVITGSMCEYWFGPGSYPNLDKCSCYDRCWQDPDYIWNGTACACTTAPCGAGFTGQRTPAPGCDCIPDCSNDPNAHVSASNQCTCTCGGSYSSSGATCNDCGNPSGGVG
ncbi:MAG: pilus assembly protein [Bdellovibrionales bacterium]|nr:pilus assembly protein [Bdellovibrionales bacterium]